MNAILLRAALLCCLAGPGLAQVPPGNPEGPPVDAATAWASAKARLDYRPDAQGLAQIVRTLQGQPGVAAEVKAAAADLGKEADGLLEAGRTGEARRVLSHAAAVLLGTGWDATSEFAASVQLRLDVPINDSSLPFLGYLAQIYPAPFKPALQLKVSLAPLLPPAPGGPGSVRMPGNRIAVMALHDVPARDLNDNPLRVSGKWPDVPDGTYAVVAEIFDGPVLITRTITQVNLVRAIQIRAAEFEARMARRAGHTDIKASIRYPFDLIRVNNAGLADNAGYDYAAGLWRSAELLLALESGKDPLTRATGNQRRHYYFADADEIMPYRLYVPMRWNGRDKLPLIVSLHGGGQDENNLLGRPDSVLERLAEERGYIVAAPLGYRPNGGYGEPFPVPAGLSATPFGFTPPFVLPRRTLQLSQQDVLNVIDRVIAEYGVDPARVYVMGNSAGGGGTWILTARFAERFAAAAPCASSMDIRGLPFERFKSVPVLACIGELDVDTRKEAARYGVAKVNEAGGSAAYLEVAKGTHGSGIEIAMPQLLDFFALHRRQ